MARKLVALDIGSANLRAIQFTAGRHGVPKVSTVAVAPLPRGVVDAGEVHDPEQLTSALRDLWSEHKLGAKQIVFGVANNSVMVRQLELEWLAPKEFAQALTFRVAEHIPMPVAETNLDYHVLAEYDAPAPDGRGTRRMVRILLVVATSDMVKSFVAPIRAAGLMPVQLELSPFALIRAVRSAALPPVPDPYGDEAADAAGTAEAVVDIGADVTTVIVHRDGQPEFVRILTGHAGNSVTDALARAQDLTFAGAEQSKIEPARGEPPEAVATSGGPDAPSDDDPTEDIVSIQAGLAVAEVRDSLDYFMSTNADVTRLSRLVLTGGGSLLPSLEQRLATELRLPVVPGQAWLHGQPLRARRRHDRTGLGDAAFQRQLAVAVGLAVGAA